MVTTSETSASIPDADPLLGTAYRAVRRIGAGAMGQVFEAEHGGLRRKVAVKLLSPKVAGDPAFMDRLRLEAQALASVRHPNVVVVHDHAVTPAGAPFIVMELLRGRTLHDLLRERGFLPLAEGLCLVDQVFAGLLAIHAAGLVHRDLKPANIFLCEERGRTVVKLLDFGIVKVSPAAGPSAIAPLRFPTQEGHALGTPRCMAPEQILGRGCDLRTDVYAAGVLLFLVLTGRDPFHEHRTDLDLLTAHVTEEPPLLSKVASQRIPAAMDRVVARALAKDPRARFASIEELGAALSESLRAVDPAPFRPVAVTEKLHAGMFHGGVVRTAPLEASMLQARPSPLPFAPKRAPTFGLPPPVLATHEKPEPRAPTRPVLVRQRIARREGVSIRWALLPVLALLGGLVALLVRRLL